MTRIRFPNAHIMLKLFPHTQTYTYTHSHKQKNAGKQKREKSCPARAPSTKNILIKILGSLKIFPNSGIFWELTPIKIYITTYQKGNNYPFSEDIPAFMTSSTSKRFPAIIVLNK